MADKSLHPIEEVPGFSEAVDLVKGESLMNMPIPWGRGQDLTTDNFAHATRDHFVLAISHGWSFQTHPDPPGNQAAEINKLLEFVEKKGIGMTVKSSLLFLDFCSTPQHPFAKGQGKRTKEQSDRFSRALKLFPQIYLNADATIHINTVEDQQEDTEYYVTLEELKGARLEQMGSMIQSTEWPTGDCPVLPFDEVVSIGGRALTKIEELKELINAPPKVTEPPKRSGLFGPLMDALMPNVACCTSGEEENDNLVLMRRCPYGMANSSPAALRGWVYLERFVSMVKCAMVPESAMRSVAFSDRPETVEEIMLGGAALRKAAAGGTESLKKGLNEFVDTLGGKKFKNTSVDKLKNVGGLGGLQGPAAANTDLDVVRALMEELAEYLAQHWESQTKKQQHRQLVLALGRGNVEEVRDVLLAGADPNMADPQGCTSLHLAAGLHRHEALKLLLEHKGDLHKQDKMGNSPAHKVALLSVEGTIHTFAILAPTKAELMLKNEAGITPYMRFEVWVQTELGNGKFLMAKNHLDSLRKQMPDLDNSSQDTHAAKADLSPVVTRLHNCSVEGRSFNVRVWEPMKLDANPIDIVCLSLEFITPARIAEPAWHMMSRAICDQWNARMWVLDYNCISSKAMEANSLEPLQDEVTKAIESLPIAKQFVLIDSSLGETTHLVFKLQSRLMTSLIINFRGFHSDDFANGDMCPKVCKRFGMIRDWCKSKNIEEMSKLLGDYAFANTPEKIKKTADQYKAIGSQEPAQFFEHAAFHCGRIQEDIMERTKMYMRSVCDHQAKGIIAVGAFSPAMWTLEAAPRLAELLPAQRIEYIHMGKSCWALEGPKQALQVGKLLAKCLAVVTKPRYQSQDEENEQDDPDAPLIDPEIYRRAMQDLERQRQLELHFKENVSSLAPESRWWPISELRFMWDKVLLIDTRPKAQRLVSWIPGSVAQEEVTQALLDKHQGKTLVTYCQLGNSSSTYAQSRPTPDPRWDDAKILKMGMAGWCFEGGVLEDASGKLTIDLVAAEAEAKFYPVKCNVKVVGAKGGGGPFKALFGRK